MGVKLYFAALLAGSANAWTVPMTMKADTAAANTRRNFFAKTTALVTSIAAPTAVKAYSVPDLPYPYEALEPYIDTPTMKIHHDKHHATYVANINKATEGKARYPS